MGGKKKAYVSDELGVVILKERFRDEIGSRWEIHNSCQNSCRATIAIASPAI